MSRVRAIALTAAAAHLLLVCLGAARLMHHFGGSDAGRAVQWYGVMSGADAGYNFFAPKVGSQVRARFVLMDSSGRRWEDDLEGNNNQEVRLRVGSLSSLFPAGPEAEPLRRDLAASWAAAALGRHPDADRVEVRVEVYWVPSMSEYREGRRPAWRVVYVATFARASAGPPGDAP